MNIAHGVSLNSLRRLEQNEIIKVGDYYVYNHDDTVRGPMSSTDTGVGVKWTSNKYVPFYRKKFNFKYYADRLKTV
jgi:hypothetical protein